MRGLYFEEFEVGSVLEHAIRRTVTEMDNTLFSCLTHNPQPLHIDYHFAASTEWCKPLVNSIFTLGVMIGVSVSDTTLGTTIGNLGMTEVKFPKPVFLGDTLRATTEIVSKRSSKSRPDAGIVVFRHRAYNQQGELVAECLRQGLMRKRPKA
jgi:acyl dehydratase